MNEAATAGAAEKPHRRSALRLAILLTLLFTETGLVVSLWYSGWLGTGGNLKWIASAAVAALPIAVAAALLFRRRFRFGLRGLLLAMSLIALFLFLSVRPLLRARSARQGSQLLTASGARLYRLPSHDQWMVRIGYKPWAHPEPGTIGLVPSWLTPLAGDLSNLPPDDAIVEVWLQDDAQVAAFVQIAERLTNLEAVDISGVSNRAMRRLEQIWPTLRSLKSVSVNNQTPIPANWLRPLTHVRFLSVWAEGPRMGSSLTSDHLQDIANLPNLEVLLIYGYGVNDGNVQTLAGSNSLQIVVLKHTDVTSAGRRQLSRALPHCKVLGD